MNNDKLQFFPNAFYDLIVFGSSTVIFAVGVALGIGFVDSATLKNIGSVDVILIFSGLLFLGYEYGRIAEAWSSALVQGPLSAIHKMVGERGNQDFLSDISEVEEALSLPAVKGARPGGKWAIYFYVMTINPRLGSDLLKRYACAITL